MADIYEWLENVNQPPIGTLEPMDKDPFANIPMDQITPLDIDTEVSESLDSNVIDGVCVNKYPQSTEIKDVIDLRRIGPNRQTFYLAKDANGKYYWFHPPRTGRDLRLGKLIRDYRSRSRREIPGGTTHGITKLRSGRRIRI